MARATKTQTKVKTGKLFEGMKVIVISENVHTVRKGRGRQHYETPEVDGQSVSSSCTSREYQRLADILDYL